MHDVLERCGWRTISCRFMIVVSTNIGTPRLAPGLNSGAMAAAEVRACFSACMNQRTNLSSAVMRKCVKSSGLNRLSQGIMNSEAGHF